MRVGTPEARQRSRYRDWRKLAFSAGIQSDRRRQRRWQEHYFGGVGHLPCRRSQDNESPGDGASALSVLARKTSVLAEEGWTLNVTA